MSPRLVRRELRARPGRVAVLMAAVTASVAFATAGFGFADQLGQLLSDVDDAAVPTVPAGTILLTADTSGATTSTALGEALIDEIAAVDGVVIATGLYDQPVSFRVSAEEQPGRPVQLRGLVLSSTMSDDQWQVVEGRAPVTADEVAVDAGGLLVGNTFVGDVAELELPTGRRGVAVVGLVEPVDGVDESSAESAATPADAAAVALSSAHVVLAPESAPQLLGAVGRVDRINVTPEPDADPDEVLAAIGAVIPDGVDALLLRDRTGATQQTVAAIDDGVRTGVTAFAVLIALIATLVVANTFSVLVAQRTRELALLRLVGASRRQLMTAVMGEAAVIGGVGAALGLVGGAVLALLAAQIVSEAGVSVGFGLNREMVIAAVAVGLVVTALGAIGPAVRAARVAPIDALSDTRGGADRRTWLGAGVAALVGVIGRPVAMVGGVPGRLGIGNARRQPSRTVAAASTLMVGLVLVGVVSTAGATARRSVEAQFDNAGRADLYVERRGLVRVHAPSFFAELRDQFDVLGDLAEVVDVEGVLVGPDSTEAQVVASGLARAARMVDLGIVDGDPIDGQTVEDEAAGEGDAAGVMLAVTTADRLGVDVDDPVTLRSTSGREAELRVVATYANTSIFGPAVVARLAAEAAEADGTLELIAVDVRDDRSTFRASRAIERTARQFPKVRVHTPSEFSELNTAVTDMVLRVIDVLLVGALGIGFAGLVSTLALSTLERRRELVMLRAVGASAEQIKSLVRIEAATVGALAAIVGLAVGTAVALVGVRFMPDELRGPAVVPWVRLVVVFVGAVAVSWLVSNGIARRATTVPPAEAGQ